ncbi:MAG: hypothetical protein JXA77_19040 [Bacteroidales bacterium]|nr:hypothetical protein [Bacteroidales bacterium]MBN2821386.1 hypothetical protein [Bacteroidales bacterium]
MSYTQLIETIGSMTKYEFLEDLNRNILENSLVLRNKFPFPGVKNENLNELKIYSFYIILRYRYAPEKINRINCKLLEEADLSRSPSYGEIIVGKNILPCVRLKNISDLQKITIIQNYLKNNDLQLGAHRIVNQECVIKIFKHFKLAEIGDGLYRDLTDGDKFYIRIQTELNWKRFESILRKIKYNLKNPEFDAAIGVIYRFQGPEHVIRVYDKDKSLQRAVELRNLFVREIKDEIHLSAAHPN